MLRTRLKAEGWDVLGQSEVNQALAAVGKPLDLSLARRLANELGADFAVYGSLTKIGSRVSLDAKLLDALGMRRPQSFFVEGVGLDALPSLSDTLARDLASSAVGGEKVAQVYIKGNKRIESEAIKAVLDTKNGGPYSPIRLDNDLKAIWKMGYFDNVKIDVEDSSDGKIVTFVVDEKPTVRELKITGNDEIDTKDLLDAIDIKLHSVFKPAAVKEGEVKIIQAYRDKGYYDVAVKSAVTTLPNGEIGVSYDVKEGEKVYIATIQFQGNEHFSDGDLRSEMSTSQEGWFSWITDDNVLESQTLEQDVEKIADFYYNHGYMDARVAAPKIERGKEGLVITINVVEGPRYKVSKLDITGDMVVPKEELMDKIQSKADDWYNRSTLREDLRTISDIYGQRGFAYVDVKPMVHKDDEAHTVDVEFKVAKGKKVYFERILITGNTATRDKVIRRELGLAEGSRFNSATIRNANMRLHRLQFFEDVNITPTKGSEADKMNLHVKVKEKRTGSFMVGAGYSTVDSIMVVGQIQETNLMGRGQTISLRGQLGGSSTRYTLSFTEPWLFDRPVSAGIDVYNWEREYISYDKTAIGARLRLGFPTPIPATRFYAYYTYEVAEVTDVDDDASVIIQDQEGEHSTSAIQFILRRDTRDHYFNPTHGSDNSISVEYAGLGGSNHFLKCIADSGWYFPLWFKHVFVLHGKAGYVTEVADGDLPIYEKFFLGGINSLRGYDYWSVSPEDPETGDPIGGETMLQFNIEYRFPLFSDFGLVGLVFYDTGNSWSEDDGYQLDNMRSSYGAGIRWNSPVGPLRLEYGRVIDPEPDEDEANWEFTVGSLF
jgi:outer membrane protein insertion porin family